MACGCSPGFSYNPVTGLCEQIINGPISVGATPAIIPAICPLEENMVNGTAIYPLITPNQFPLTGQNTLSPSFVNAQAVTIVPSSTILSGSLWLGGSIFTGLLNQRGVGLPLPLNTWYGVNRCVTVNQGDIISFALSAKTAFRLYIDGVLAIIYQPNLPAQANKNLHIFPISLSAGPHTFRAEALSSASYSCGGAMVNGNFLVEVYLNVTPALLASITTQVTLNSYYAPTNGSIPALIVGQTFDVSSNIALGQGYCASGGYLNACTVGGFTCTTVNTLPYVPCCFNLTNCVTGAIIVTSIDLSAYIGHIIKISEASGCFIVSPNNTTPCPGAIPVTVGNVYETCKGCELTFYKLTDCKGIAADIITTTDLSLSLGGVIKIDGISGICWIVTVTTEVPSPVLIVKSADFTSCETCLYVPPTPLPDPPFYHLSPVSLKTRSVQPGYDTEHCSVELVEKVNCNFANQVYSMLLEQKYGVESCIVDEYDKYFIKKQLLELNLIDNPDYCHATSCEAPCGISVNVQEFDPITNTAPIGTTSNLIFTPTNLPAPGTPIADIDFQSPPTF